jgi:hypothetical protein
MPSRSDCYTALPAHGSRAENLGLRRNLEHDTKLHTIPGRRVEGDLEDTKLTHSTSQSISIRRISHLSTHRMPSPETDKSYQTLVAHRVVSEAVEERKEALNRQGDGHSNAKAVPEKLEASDFACAIVNNKREESSKKDGGSGS